MLAVISMSIRENLFNKSNKSSIKIELNNNAFLMTCYSNSHFHFILIKIMTSRKFKSIRRRARPIIYKKKQFYRMKVEKQVQISASQFLRIRFNADVFG